MRAAEHAVLDAARERGLLGEEEAAALRARCSSADELWRALAGLPPDQLQQLRAVYAQALAGQATLAPRDLAPAPPLAPHETALRATAFGPALDPAEADAPAAPPLFQRGQRLGPYELERELARGGMGAVFVARHAQLGRLVALKVLLARGRAHGSTLLRFLTEAEAAAKLRHPNIVAVHEAGRAGDCAFLTMELVNGESLADRLGRGPLTIAEAARIVLEVAGAIRHAHERGVLHRDLKPANVLLSRQDGRALLTDFGLAKLVDAEGLTRTGELMGTPAFMAPEQAAGHASRADVRTDVYGLGATLYFALTGAPPFDAGSMMAMLVQIATKAPEPPSSRRADVPPALDAICMKCLEKVPDRRYPGAAALEEDLRRFLAGEAPSVLEQRRARVGARRLALLAAGAAVAGALAVWAGRGSPPPPPTPAASVAGAGERAAQVDPERALDEVLGLRGAEQVAAAERWLRDFPEHPRADEVGVALLAAKVAVGPQARADVEQTASVLWFEGRDLLIGANGMGGDLPFGRILRWSPPARQAVGAALFARERWRELHAAATHASGWTALGGVDSAGPCVWLLPPAGAADRIARRVALEAEKPAEAPFDAVESLALSPDGALLAVGHRYGRLEVVRWSDLEAGRPDALRLERMDGPVAGLAFADDRTLVVACSNYSDLDVSNRFAVWDLAPASPRLLDSERLDGPVVVAERRPGTRQVLLGTHWTSRLRLYDCERGALLEDELLGEGVRYPPRLGREGGPAAHTVPIRQARFSPDGRRLYSVAGVRDGPRELRVWDVETRREIARRLEEQDYYLAYMAISGDGRWLAIAGPTGPDGRAGVLELWDVAERP